MHDVDNIGTYIYPDKEDCVDGSMLPYSATKYKELVPAAGQC